jgi:hypothetical protein
MERRPPTPVRKYFVLCRQIFVDPARQDYTLVSPVHQVFCARYPAVEDLSVFARWSNSHGSYAVEVQLHTIPTWTVMQWRWMRAIPPGSCPRRRGGRAGPSEPRRFPRGWGCRK